MPNIRKTMTNNDIVQKLWNLCDVLKTTALIIPIMSQSWFQLLFIKMVHENTESGVLNKHFLPEGKRWPDISEGKSGIALLNYYKQMLLDLSKTATPMIAAIYAEAQSSLREPRHLEQLIKSLDQIDWFSAQKDGLGDLLKVCWKERH